MSGLSFVACEVCDTVHAEPVAPAACRHCGAAELVDITDRLRGTRYFAPPTQ